MAHATRSTLSSEDAHPTDSIDFLLGALGEELRLDNDWLIGQHALAKHLEVTRRGHVDNGGNGLVVRVLLADTVTDQGPQAARGENNQKAQRSNKN